MTAQPTAPTRTGSRVLLQGFFADPSFDYGIRNILGATAYGVGDVGTVLATAARIIDGDWASWFSAWTDRADRLAALGARRRDARDLRGASWAFLAAADAWSRSLDAVDGLPTEQGEAVLLPTFRKGRDCWEALIDCSDSRFLRVDVPYEDTALPGYLLRPDATGTGRPTLVMTNGSDRPITAMWSAGAAEALDRGWNAFLYDGPGQQSMLFERGTTFRPDWEAVLTPVVDALVGRPDVDATALAAYGISQAGYWVPRALAFEHRFVAAVADPGVVDVSTSWMEHLPGEMLQLLDAGSKDDFDRYMSQTGGDAQTARTFAYRARPFGMSSPFDLFTEVRRYQLRDVVGGIRTPLLITDPEDEQFWPGQSQQLAGLLTAPHAVTHDRVPLVLSGGRQGVRRVATPVSPPETATSVFDVSPQVLERLVGRAVTPSPPAEAETGARENCTKTGSG